MVALRPLGLVFIQSSSQQIKNKLLQYMLARLSQQNKLHLFSLHHKHQLQCELTNTSVLAHVCQMIALVEVGATAVTVDIIVIIEITILQQAKLQVKNRVIQACAVSMDSLSTLLKNS